MKKRLFLRAGTGFAAVRQGNPDRVSPETARLADLAAQYEELLDQVWRCEREWKLDDRIAYACRTRLR